MWYRLGQFILKNRIVLSIIVVAITVVMAFFASKVGLSYEFTRAIPTDHPAFQSYQQFKQKFGEDGNLVVIGIQNEKLFETSFFNAYAKLSKDLKKIDGVDDVIGVASAINLVKDSATEKLSAASIFPDRELTQAEVDSSAAIFKSLPFY
ncbi:MAG: RND transporter, partial [Pedobacter sp.]